MDNTLIELHSESCVCRGYGWHAHPPTRPASARACCALRNPGDDSTVTIDVDHWLELGLPRTLEAYRRAEEQQRLGTLTLWEIPA